MSKHMKRLVSPKSWGIEKKTSTWVVKTRPGPHPIEMSVPLIVVLRDMLELCDSSREAEHILSSRGVMIDGRIITDGKFPVGLMDVVTIIKTGSNHRMVLDTHGRLRLTAIAPEESKMKLVRIQDKTIVKGGKFQLNLHDGRNIILAKNQYKTGDVLKIELPSQKILKQIPLKEGSLALLVAGSHPGALVTVNSFEIKRGSSQNLVGFKEGYSTVWDNVFVVGEKVPEVKLPEVSAI